MKTMKKQVKKTVYKVTAVYSPKYRTATDVKNVLAKLSKNPRARAGKVRKSGNVYTIPVKFTYLVANVTARNSAVKTAKAHGAKVSVSQVKR